MRLLEWIAAKWCAHRWETVAQTEHEFSKYGDTSNRVVLTKRVFHERCAKCGTNNVRIFSI